MAPLCALTQKLSEPPLTKVSPTESENNALYSVIIAIWELQFFLNIYLLYIVMNEHFLVTLWFTNTGSCDMWLTLRNYVVIFQVFRCRQVYVSWINTKTVTVFLYPIALLLRSSHSQTVQKATTIDLAGQYSGKHSQIQQQAELEMPLYFLPCWLAVLVEPLVCGAFWRRTGYLDNCEPKCHLI